jgi:electron transfer flavoprotein alpha subunit
VKIEQAVREIPSQVDLADAEVIVAGGKGMQAGENFRLLEDLAEVLGGTSRPLHGGDFSEAAGVYGQRPVRCPLYIACISNTYNI